MLMSFLTRRAFHKTVVSIHVDRATKTAEATVTFDGRIVWIGRVPYRDVETPDRAEGWLSDPVDARAGAERGKLSRLEAIHMSNLRDASPAQHAVDKADDDLANPQPPVIG